MKHFLLSVEQPDGPPPAPDVLEQIMRDVQVVDDEMRAAGAWVFAAGLHAASEATVLRARGDRVLATDGPYVESKEHLGGVSIIRAADMAEAVEWGSKLARATTLPIEVREFQGEGPDVPA
jgi:hypothetical protein